MRWALALVLVGLAAVFGAMAYGPLHNLWGEYQDSAASTYLLFGLPFLALAVACLVAAVLIVRPR